MANFYKVMAEYLSNEQIERLATYNAERSRGIVHTEEWQEAMAELQTLWDAGKNSWEEGVRAEHETTQH